MVGSLGHKVQIIQSSSLKISSVAEINVELFYPLNIIYVDFFLYTQACMQLVLESESGFDRFPR